MNQLVMELGYLHVLAIYILPNHDSYGPIIYELVEAGIHLETSC